MRVIMKTRYATPEFSAEPGQTLDLPREEALYLVDTRQAVLENEDPATGGTRKRRPRRSSPAEPGGGAEGETGGADGAGDPDGS